MARICFLNKLYERIVPLVANHYRARQLGEPLQLNSLLNEVMYNPENSPVQREYKQPLGAIVTD